MQYKWRSSIKPTYKWRCVLRAALVGGVGIILLVAGGAFTPVHQLSLWGLPLLLLSGGLITWSMLPYRRMVQLENAPDELWINSRGDLVYAKKSTPIFTVPQQTIEKIFYIEKPSIYGICLHLKPSLSEKVRIHYTSFDFRSFRKNSVHLYGCDIFFPLFSDRTFRELDSYLGEEGRLPS